MLLAPSGKRRPPMGRTLLGHWNDALEKIGGVYPGLNGWMQIIPIYPLVICYIAIENGYL